MSHLSDDLVENIVSRVPLKSLGAVRSTCKPWNNLSKDRILCKSEARQQFLGFVIKDRKFCSFRFNLHEDFRFVETSIKQIDIFDQVKISQVFHSDGLLLLVTKEENIRLVVWNPYLAQTRWIKPRNSYGFFNIYAFGYDNNRNHKILMITVENDKIFDFESNSWRVVNDGLPYWDKGCVQQHDHSVSLKGNTYFLATLYLHCFHFSTEKYGLHLPLPHRDKYCCNVVLSSTRDEQLAVLYRPHDTFEVKIWVTTKIEPNAVLWSNFLTVDFAPLPLNSFAASFFIDLEKKLAVLFDISIHNGRICIIAYTIGESGCLRKVDLEETHLWYCHQLVNFYVPSLVQISQGLDRGF